MTKATDIVDYANALLKVGDCKDYCPNGLQIVGSDIVTKIVSGVSLNADLIDAAVAADADTILVHHGVFWNSDSSCLHGIKRNRIAKILANNLNLISYHLPLDLAPKYGNNYKIAEKLSWDITTRFDMLGIENLGFYSELNIVLEPQHLQVNLANVFGQDPMYIPAYTQKPITAVAWCSGAAEDGIERAKEMGADAYISGEISERTYHLAKELDIAYFMVGHHASERFGVAALGEHLATRYNIKHEFIDITNPI